MRMPFTDNCKKALDQAALAARHFGHEFIGTEHILVGILKLGKCRANEALKNVGVDSEDLLNEIEANISHEGGVANKGNLPFTPRAIRVVTLSESAAMEEGAEYIGAEHLLVALLIEGQGVAAQILLSHGVFDEELKDNISQIPKDSEANPPQKNPFINIKPLLHFSSSASTQTQKRKSKTPAADSFSRDLTALAHEGKLDPVIGRKNEIERVIQILSRRTKNNPVLIGDPGVGKTAVVEGLAQKIISGDVPDTLKDKRILTLDLGAIVAGTKYRGEFEDRLKRILKEITTVGNIILFIDEVHLLVGAGSAEGSMDAANILKPPLSRGELQCIGATTLDEYRKYVESDAALERRFQMIAVDEPTAEETIEILKGLKERYAEHHGVVYSDEALVTCAHSAARYVSDRFLPDKAIDLMDEAGSVKKLCAAAVLDPVIVELRKKIEDIALKKNEALKREAYEECAELKVEEDRLADELMKRIESNKGKDKPVVDSIDVFEVISRWTGIALTRLKEDEVIRLLRMEDEIGKRFVGQKEAVNSIANAIRRSRTGMKDPRRPTGSFLFLGPTGAGQTELARALSVFLFDNEDALIRIDMSEFMERHSISRLIGSPPGYVGYEEGGLLTEKVRRKPYSVVLFDEIEKAHPEVFNMLLQILDDGRLSDSLGHTVDFRNTVIILTSNLGAREIVKGQSVGFSAGEVNDDYERMKNKVMDEMKQYFTPEFLNRLDDIIVFRSLTRIEIEKIAQLMINDLIERLNRDSEIKIEVDESAIKFVVDEGFDPSMGARPLRRAIQKRIEDGLANVILNRGKISTIKVLSDGKEIIFE